MYIAILIATLLCSVSLWAQEPTEGYDHDPDAPVVYTNSNECLDDLMQVLGKSYKVISKDVLVQLEKDGTLNVYRSNYKISKALPNGSCFDDSKHILRGYNTVLINGYTKAKEKCKAAEKKAGPGNPVNSTFCDAMIACDNQNRSKPADWYREGTELVPNLKQGDSGSTK